MTSQRVRHGRFVQEKSKEKKSTLHLCDGDGITSNEQAQRREASSHILDNINNSNELHAIVSQLLGDQNEVIHDKNIKIYLRDVANCRMLTATLNEKKYS